MLINLPKLGPVDFDDSLSPEQFHSELERLATKYDFDIPVSDETHSLWSAAKSGVKEFGGSAEQAFGHIFNLPGVEESGKKLVSEAQQNYQPYSDKELANLEQQGLGSWLGAEAKNVAGETLQGLGRYAVPTIAGGIGSLAAGPVGGIAAFGATDFAANLGENINYQQQANPNKDVNTGQAAAAALGQTVLDRVGIPFLHVLPKSIREKFGTDVAGLASKIESGDIKPEDAINQLGSKFGPYLKSVAANYTGLVGMGVGDEALRRAQAGQDVTSPDALQAYKDQLVGAAAPAALFGGIGGYFGARNLERNRDLLRNVAVPDLQDQTAAPPPDLQDQTVAVPPPPPQTNVAPPIRPGEGPTQLNIPFTPEDVSGIAGAQRAYDQQLVADRIKREMLQKQQPTPLTPEPITGTQGQLDLGTPPTQGELDFNAPTTTTTPVNTVLTPDALKATGLKPQSAFFKQLVNKDLANPDHVQDVANILANVRQNDRLAQSTKDSVHQLAGQLFNAAATQGEMFGPRGGVLKGAESGKLRAKPDTGTSGESISVPSGAEPSGVTPTIGKPEATGLGSPAEPTTQLGAGETTEPSTLTTPAVAEPAASTEPLKSQDEAVAEHKQNLSDLQSNANDLLNNRLGDALETVGDERPEPTDLSNTPEAKQLHLASLLNDYITREANRGYLDENTLNAQQAETEKAILSHGDDGQMALDFVKENPPLARTAIREMQQDALRSFDNRVIKPEVGGRAPVKKSELKTKEPFAKESLIADDEPETAKKEVGTSKENADYFNAHAEDIGGTVAYSNGDIGLVRGYSRLSGEPVYSGVKKDFGRTRLDIDSYEGNIFSEKDLAELRAAKKELEEKAAEQHATNPFIKFKDGVALSKDIPNHIANIAKEWKKLLGLKNNIYITTIEDAKANKNNFTGIHRVIGSATLNASERGSKRLMRNGDYYIAFTKSTSPTKMLEVLAHEFGHVHQEIAYENASPDIKNAIKADYEKWLASTKGMTAKELVQSLRAKTTGKTTKVPPEMMASELTNYWRGFEEWYADQVSRWAMTSEKPVSVVEKFFARLGNALRNFYNKLVNKKYLPTETMKDFLDRSSEHLNFTNEAAPIGSKSESMLGDVSHPVDDLNSSDPERIGQGFSKVGDAVNSLPAFVGDKIEGLKNAVSNVQNGGLKRMFFKTQRLEMLNHMYPDFGVKETGTKLLKSLQDLLSGRQGAIDNHITEADKIFTRARQIAKVNPNAMKTLDKLAIDARLAEVDLLNPKETEAQWNDRRKKAQIIDESSYKDYSDEYDRLSKIWNNKSLLPDYVKRSYTEMRAYYDKVLTDFQNSLFGDDGALTPGAKAKLLGQFEAMRNGVKGYIPLMRFGDWVVKYINPETGEPMASQFESFRERQRFVDTQLKGVEGVQLLKRIQDLKYSPSEVPPTSFIGKIITDLAQNGAPPEVLDSVYQNYLLTFPVGSIKKRFLHAKRVGGVDPLGKGDYLVKTFGQVAPQWGRRIANSIYAPKLANVFAQVKHVGETTSDPTTSDLAQHVLGQAKFQYDPTYGPWVHNATAMSYFEYIAGNISSAFVHFMHVPLTVYPTLGAEHTYGGASKALSNAFKVVNKGLENNPKYAVLYQMLKDRAQIDHTTQREILQNRNAPLDTLHGVFGNVSNLLSLPFAVSEKYTRRLTAVAAYDLAREKGMSPEAAADYATDIVMRTQTSGIAAMSPTIMQHPFGRMFLTFKNFVWNTSSMFARAVYESIKHEDPETQRIARRQAVGMLFMATALAGAKGLPFYGAAETTANMLNALLGDGSPYDFNEEMKKHFGELFSKGPFNYFLNADLADRMGYGQDLLFRDDPRMISQDGYVLWAMRNMFGPLGSYAANAEQAVSEFNQGHIERGIEGLLPNFMRNAMKGYRYVTQGATTIDGIPIQQDIGAYNGLMQAIGFAPADVASKMETKAAVDLYQKQVERDRTNIVRLYVMGATTGDDSAVEMAMNRMDKFNDAHPDYALNGGVLSKALKAHNKALNDSINGIQFNKHLINEVNDKFNVE